MLGVRLIVPVLLLLCACAPDARADVEAAKAHYRQGMAEFMLNRYDQAIAEFKLGFHEDPEPAFLYNIARSYDQSKRPAEAIEYYHKYLVLTPNASDRASVEQRMTELEQALKTSPPADQPASVASHPQPADGGPQLVQKRAPSGSERRPVVKRAWFWATIGGAVALVGAGVALGVVYGHPSDPLPSIATVHGP
jgi:tetratricopeptide (TPR) repeat protein